jgi:hypothetical protein
MGGAILCVWKGDNGASRAFESFQDAILTVDDDPQVRAGETETGGSGGSLEPLGLFLRTSIPFIWRIVSAFLPA